MMEGPGADSEEKHEPVSDIDTVVVVVGLKALDPEWPIREAIGARADMCSVRRRSPSRDSNSSNRSRKMPASRFVIRISYTTPTASLP